MGVGFLCLAVLVCLTQGGATPLDDYVNRPDPTYEYKILSKVRGATHTLYTLNMTSQTWKPDLQSQPVWWHYLSITIPDKVTRDSAFMLIDGGSNHDGPPSQTDNFVELTTIVAVSTNSVGACLKQVPNEPITFKADPTQKSRTEDAIIAWTWKTFVDQNGRDPEILLRMPMTKATWSWIMDRQAIRPMAQYAPAVTGTECSTSTEDHMENMAAVRGMDTIQDLALKQANVKINRFLVSGASKRGWATWTTAAVDKRVVGLAPMVMDLLSLVKNLHHYYRSLGGWTFAFGDYYYLNFTDQLDNPATQMMADIIDPISYKDRYKNKPLLIISTGGDEFFMVDDSRYYYDHLVGPTYLRMVPNAEHSLAMHETSVMFSIRAFYLSVMTTDVTAHDKAFSVDLRTVGTALPKMSWNMDYTATGGRITLQTDREPETVHVYYATTLDGQRKDFRLLRGTPGDPSKPEVHPVIWLSQPAMSKGNNTFVAECDNPDVGWTAFFIQVTFRGVDDAVLEFTTQTLITPDTYPFPDCHGHSCLGVLV